MFFRKTGIGQAADLQEYQDQFDIYAYAGDRVSEEPRQQTQLQVVCEMMHDQFLQGAEGVICDHDVMKEFESNAYTLCGQYLDDCGDGSPGVDVIYFFRQWITPDGEMRFEEGTCQNPLRYIDYDLV